MKIEKPSYEILSFTPEMTKLIERAGRICWKSEDKICDGSADPFIERLKNFKHMSVLEHGSITILFNCDRGISHELVRHRVASFSQSSTRYCNYAKDKFGREITVIDPRGSFWEDSDTGLEDTRYQIWYASMQAAETSYFALLDAGATPQQARNVLPNSLKTEIIVTANIREWRHILTLRTDRAAHPQIRELMLPLLEDCAKRWPILFQDILDELNKGETSASEKI